MKKIVSALLLSLLASQASACIADSSIQANLEQCVALAQHGMSNEEILATVQTALDQAALNDSLDFEIKKPSNKKLILCIVGGVVVVGVVGAGVYYWYKSSQAKKHADVKIVNKIADILDILVELTEEDAINLVMTILATTAKGSAMDMPTNVAEARQSIRELIKYARTTVSDLRNGKDMSEEIRANVVSPQTQALLSMFGKDYAGSIEILPNMLKFLPDIKKLLEVIDLENTKFADLNPEQLMEKMQTNPELLIAFGAIMEGMERAQEERAQAKQNAQEKAREREEEEEEEERYSRENRTRSEENSSAFYGASEAYEFYLSNDGHSDQTARKEREKAYEDSARLRRAELAEKIAKQSEEDYCHRDRAYFEKQRSDFKGTDSDFENFVELRVREGAEERQRERDERAAIFN